MSAGLAEVLAEHVLGQYDNGGGDEWVEVRSVEELTAVVTEWLGERLRAEREYIADLIDAAFYVPGDTEDGPSFRATVAADAALAVVGKALGIEVDQ